MLIVPSVPAPAVGSLIRARGRDWVVLPAEEPEVVRLRPLTGSEAESIGLFLPLEGRFIKPSTFELPNPAKTGDTTGGLLLRDAVRLSLRSGAAPFRSLGRIAVVARPYQFVPLIMALRQDPVRLLIADDVGVGKTIEAGMIARELLDRGLARRLAVICPSHLCDQWERELAEKFALQTAVIQPSRIARLERDLPRGDLSVYRYYPHLVASVDFVKSDRNRGAFLDNAPDLVIVDEAHMAARPRGAERAQQQRYELLRLLAADRSRHLLLVTATPHSGVEESFRSLLGLLDPAFDPAPSPGQATPPELDRRQLLPHVVQRRRHDVERWLGSETPFPKRDPFEPTYQLSPAYRQLFDEVLAYCRESVRGGSDLRAQQQRVRHWAAIALLRCVLSSPEAALAVLGERARRQGLEPGSDAETTEEVDARYRPQVLDPLDEEGVSDYVPSAPLEHAEPLLSEAERRRLGAFLRQARGVAGEQQDRKLAEAALAVGEMLRAGFRPIVFCRFIATARYLGEWLPRLLGPDFPGLRVAIVTGEIGDEERRARVEELADDPLRVLVATDCLSEGINLQHLFDAVLHYDLPWNPNRLEQREGRVDRFGQEKPVVRTALLYGADNPVDLVVLDVLIQKARTIRRRLGIAVPVPVESEQVVQAVVDSVLLRAPAQARGVQLELGLADPEVGRLHAAWDAAAAQQDKQRAYFAQHGIRPDEVARELEATDPVLGDAAAVQRFLANALQRFNGELRSTRRDGVFELQPGDLRETLERRAGALPTRVAFDRLKDERATNLGRTHPLVSACCDAVLGAALGGEPDPRFARAGALFTDAVQRRTAVLLLRLRYLLREQVEEFAEEVVLPAFERREGAIAWLEPLERSGADLLERAWPVANMPPAERSEHVAWALDFLQRQGEWFTPIVERRKAQLQASHDRLRKLVRDGKLEVKPHTPPDILGCYVLVPAGSGR